MSSPAIQFYVGDWIISTRGLSPEARGVYIDLLCIGWDQDGIPADPKALAAMVGVTAQRFRRIWAEIESKWVPAESGRLRNRRQELERQNARSRYIPARIRRAVLERDEFTCVECATSEDLTLDHIHPFSRGGPHDEENLRVLCQPCNSRKGARVLTSGGGF